MATIVGIRSRSRIEEATTESGSDYVVARTVRGHQIAVATVDLIVSASEKDVAPATTAQVHDVIAIARAETDQSPAEVETHGIKDVGSVRADLRELNDLTGLGHHHGALDA